MVSNMITKINKNNVIDIKNRQHKWIVEQYIEWNLFEPLSTKKVSENAYRLEYRNGNYLEISFIHENENRIIVAVKEPGAYDESISFEEFSLCNF